MEHWNGSRRSPGQLDDSETARRVPVRRINVQGTDHGPLAGSSGSPAVMAHSITRTALTLLAISMLNCSSSGGADGGAGAGRNTRSEDTGAQPGTTGGGGGGGGDHSAVPGPGVSCTYPRTTGQAYLYEGSPEERDQLIKLAFGSHGGLLSFGERACTPISTTETPPWAECQQGYDCDGCEFNFVQDDGAWYLYPHERSEWPPTCADIERAYRVYPLELEPLDCTSIPDPLGCYQVGDVVVEFPPDTLGIQAVVRTLSGETYSSCLADTRENDLIDDCYNTYRCDEACSVRVYAERQRTDELSLISTGVEWRAIKLGSCPFELRGDPEPVECPPKPGLLPEQCQECLRTCLDVLGSHHSCCTGTGCMCDDECDVGI